MSNLNFTVQEAIVIQQEQLAKWKKVLRPSVYSSLEKWAEEFNEVVTSPYNVTRGCELSGFVENFMHGHTPAQNAKLYEKV